MQIFVLFLYFCLMTVPSMIYVLRSGDKVVATFGNLKRLCEYASEKYGDFPSYWTLTRISALGEKEPYTYGSLKIDRVPLERSTRVVNT